MLVADLSTWPNIVGTGGDQNWGWQKTGVQIEVEEREKF